MILKGGFSLHEISDHSLSSYPFIRTFFPPLKPPLKWAGGKRWLIPHLKSLYEPFRKYRIVEPFCGGLAVTLALFPSRALLNDINPHVISFYCWLQRGFRIEFPMRNEKEMYYTYRERFNFLIKSKKSDSAEATGLFYYLNKTGYNGLCRFNQKGFFNVPFGQYIKINYEKDFSRYQSPFSQWEFSAKDFMELHLNCNDFVYADPPYDVEFTHYAKEDFNWKDQVRLAKWLSRHPGPVVLSNQATPRIVALYRDLGFALQFLEAPRMISCNGNRARVQEVLALKGLK